MYNTDKHMLKSFGLIDNIWFDPKVKFPLKIGDRYTFRKLYEGRFEYQKLLREWELSQNNSTGRYPYTIEVKHEHEGEKSSKKFAENELVNLP